MNAVKTWKWLNKETVRTCEIWNYSRDAILASEM